MQVQDTARIKTRAWPAMRKQGRAKDWRDLEDRFGSSSQVSPVMTGHILHVYEESSSPAIPGYYSFIFSRGKHWIGGIKSYDHFQWVEWERPTASQQSGGCLCLIQYQGQHRANCPNDPLVSNNQRHGYNLECVYECPRYSRSVLDRCFLPMLRHKEMSHKRWLSSHRKNGMV